MRDQPLPVSPSTLRARLRFASLRNSLRHLATIKFALDRRVWDKWMASGVFVKADARGQPTVWHGYLRPRRRSRPEAKSIECISSPDLFGGTTGARAEAGPQRLGGKLDILLSCYALERLADVSLPTIPAHSLCSVMLSGNATVPL